MSAPVSACRFVPADVDECRRVPPPCDRGRCENTPGSFLCVCPAGYQAAPHGAGCQGEGPDGAEGKAMRGAREGRAAVMRKGDT